MLTQRVVIQKIMPKTGIVQLYQNYELRGPWSFEANDSENKNSPHPDIFPFTFGSSELFSVGRAGGETKVHFSSEGNLLFADDYAIPAGFLIGILFPQGYFPEIFKFKDKPFIPTGTGIAGASMQPPGFFDLFINRNAELAAITFMITTNTYFGFKCIAKPRTNAFPKVDKFPFYNDLFATLKFQETHPIQIHAEDLESYKQVFKPEISLSEIADLLNKLVAITEARSTNPMEKESLIKKLQGALSSADSAVTIADSFVSGGVMAQIISRLLLYLTL